MDGWVSLEVSPLLAYDTARTVGAAKSLHAQADRPNLFIKIPGTTEGLAAIDRGDRRGDPGERHPAVLGRPLPWPRPRPNAQGWSAGSPTGLDPAVGSVASVFMSRWDVAVANEVPADLEDKLGLAVGPRRLPGLPRSS